MDLKPSVPQNPNTRKHTCTEETPLLHKGLRGTRYNLTKLESTPKSASYARTQNIKLSKIDGEHALAVNNEV